MTEKTIGECDDSNDNTNDEESNGSNNTINSTVRPAIENSSIPNIVNDSNNTLHEKGNATTAQPNKETTTKPTDNTNSTTERIKTQSKGGFSAGSFIGGIVLVICASLVTFYGVRYYKTYRDGRPFSFRIFNNNHGFAARQETDDTGFPF